MTRHFIETDVASESEATAGTANDKLMTPLRVAQSASAAVVKVTGTAQVGEVLTASIGEGWSVTGYQWTRDGSDISGETSSTYTLVSADNGSTITCRVTGLSFTGTGVSVTLPSFDKTSMVAWYDLADVNDSHTGARNLTNIGTATFSTGKIGDAVYLNGSDQSLERASESAFNFSGDFTIGAWIYATSAPTNNTGVVAKFLGSGSDNRSYALVFDSSRRVRFALSSDGTSQASNVLIDDTQVLDLNQWHFVCGVLRAGASQEIWVAGAKAKEKTTSVISSVFASSAPLTIGRQFSTSSLYHFPGRIDSAFFAGRAYSSSEISDLYNSGFGTDYAGLG